MGVRAYNRGSRVLREMLDREMAERRVVRKEVPVVKKFWATLEYLSDNEGLVTLFESGSEWSGAGKVRSTAGREWVYENAYNLASLSARDKGGRLDRFTVV